MSEFLTKRQASEYLTKDKGLPVSKNTLSQLITKGGGPKYQKFGRRVIYTQSELDQWTADKLSNKFIHANKEINNDK